MMHRMPPSTWNSSASSFSCGLMSVGIIGVSLSIIAYFVADAVENVSKWTWQPSSGSEDDANVDAKTDNGDALAGTQQPVSIAHAVNFAQSNCYFAARAVTMSANLALDSRRCRIVRGAHMWPYVGAILWLRCVKMPSCIEVAMSVNGYGHAFVLLQQDKGKYALLHSFQARFAMRHEEKATLSEDEIQQWLCEILKEAFSWSAIRRYGVFAIFKLFWKGQFIVCGDKVFEVARKPCGDLVHESLATLMGCKSKPYSVKLEFVPHNAARFNRVVPLVIPLANNRTKGFPTLHSDS